MGAHVVMQLAPVLGSKGLAELEKLPFLAKFEITAEMKKAGAQVKALPPMAGRSREELRMMLDAKNFKLHGIADGQEAGPTCHERHGE